MAGDGEEVRLMGEGGEEAERIKATRDERVVKELLDPRKPTEKEVEEHERTHLPYRNWCSTWIIGRKSARREG